MKTTVLTFLFCISLSAFAQKGITFQVEKLSKPEELLNLTSFDEICKRLILSDVKMSSYEIERENINFPFNIIAKSQLPDSLVYLGYHSFFNGMYNAYANHRPFVLSPDMIWLLISQGFAQHVNANSEKMRHHFVDFSRNGCCLRRTQTVCAVARYDLAFNQSRICTTCECQSRKNAAAFC